MAPIEVGCSIHWAKEAINYAGYVIGDEHVFLPIDFLERLVGLSISIMFFVLWDVIPFREHQSLYPLCEDNSGKEELLIADPYLESINFPFTCLFRFGWIGRVRNTRPYVRKLVRHQ